MQNSTFEKQERMYDLIVIGGGITGAGVARDAALRGLSCLLLEKKDFASGVTSKTTRLIHGGLRYLANFELGLVAESLRERAILRQQAPHLIHPLPIVIPIYRGDPHGRAVIAIGIHLYDLLSHDRDLPHYFTSDAGKTLACEPRLNRTGLRGSALFYDHQILMPERLVIENIIAAREAGATARSYCAAEKIEELGDRVRVSVRDALTGEPTHHHARVVINAAGPWVDAVRNSAGVAAPRIMHPTKGIHLVVPRLSDQALFVSSRDERMFFILPFGPHSLIGTTDTNYGGDLDDVHAEAADVDYLLAESRRVLPGLRLEKASILYTYAGIRPLAFSGTRESKISRKHRVIAEGASGRILTICGGKLTTYRNMAGDVVDAACRVLGVKTPCTTGSAALPGGFGSGYDLFLREGVREVAARYKVTEELVCHLAGVYGSRLERILAIVRDEPELGKPLAPDSRDIAAQVVYSIREEQARVLDDIMLRRMHIGLTATRGREHAETVAALAGRELLWNNDEQRSFVAKLYQELDGDRKCLAGTASR